MKQLAASFILILSLISIQCSNAKSAGKPTPENSFAEIKFRAEEGQMGIIPAKGTTDYNFVFLNTGNTPLTLTEVKGSCHCVYTDWSKIPVNPGDSAKIKVSFDPEGVPGIFIRTITVRSNAKTDSLQLRITGEVLDPAKKQ